MRKIPRIYIIAGPNGAGKTTFARKFLPDYTNCTNFVNADLIASGLAPFSPESAGLKAGKLLLSEIHSFALKKADFAFETTLSGKTYLSFLEKQKQEGYLISLFFLWIPNVSLAVKRIKERVNQGGHNVEIADVVRRFSRSVRNFFTLYKPLLDVWFLFDNSAQTPHLIAEGKREQVIIRDAFLFSRIQREIK